MRIEGKHSSGVKVVIMKNDIGLFDLYCYYPNGTIVYEDSFNRIDLAKSAARKKYGAEGKWHWDIRLKLMAQQWFD